jgi:hypothetical protein
VIRIIVHQSATIVGYISGDECGLIDPMLTSILIGAGALVAVCLCFSLFLFAHLTGRVRRATALAGVGARRRARRQRHRQRPPGQRRVRPMSIPFGVFLMVAAGIAGLLVYQAPKPGASR